MAYPSVGKYNLNHLIEQLQKFDDVMETVQLFRY